MEKFIIGTYSQEGIHNLNFNNGSLSFNNSFDKFENCSYLCAFKNNIYSIIEYSEKAIYKNGALISLSCNFDNCNSVFLTGNGPCFILLDTYRNLLYIANYGDGTLDIFSLDTNQNINKLIYHKTYTSHSRIHHIVLSEDKNYLFVVDLGDNKLYSYKIKYENYEIELLELYYYCFDENVAPRHLVTYSDNIYVITENSCELYHLKFSETCGFSLIDCSYLFNSEKHDNFTGCALRISSDNKFIYASVRGKNCISIFETSPKLKIIQEISCFGNIPRDINFNDSQNYLLCANQSSNNISIFNRNQKTGLLQYNNSYYIDAPACIVNYEVWPESTIIF